MHTNCCQLAESDARAVTSDKYTSLR